MAAKTTRRNGSARPGDCIEVHTIGGGPPRRGQVLEVMGRGRHRRFRVRWDEKHESIHYPGNIFHVADRIAVLRLGRHVATFDRRTAARQDVVAAITGGLVAWAMPLAEGVGA